MSVPHRIRKNRSHLTLNHKTESSLRLHRPDPEILKGRERVEDSAEEEKIFIAYQFKSLEDDPRLPRWLKWVLRKIYDHYEWAANDHDGKSYCQIQWRGSFYNEADARWAASCPGGRYRALPLNGLLPEETCQYGIYDVPLSSHSPNYRNRSLSFVAVPRERLVQLEKKVEQVYRSASA